MATEATVDGVPRRVALAVAATPLGGFLALIVLFTVARPTYYALLREDNVVEWLQFGLCLLVAWFAVAAGVQLLATGQQRLIAIAVLGVGVGAGLLAGEEISWGQRVFALEAPEDLVAVNMQQELTVHNVAVPGGLDIQALFKLVSWGIGIGGTALALLVRGPHPLLRGPRWDLVVPPLWTVPGFLGTVLYWPLISLAPDLAPLSSFQEWVEVALHLSLAATLACVLLRAVDGARNAGSAGPLTRPRVRRLTWAAVLVIAATTAVFAALTAHHGILPGNVQPTAETAPA